MAFSHETGALAPLMYGKNAMNSASEAASSKIFRIIGNTDIFTTNTSFSEADVPFSSLFRILHTDLFIRLNGLNGKGITLLALSARRSNKKDMQMIIKGTQVK